MSFIGCLNLRTTTKDNVEWLNGGDQNSKFFHQRDSRRRARNAIKGLEDESGKWVTSNAEIIGVIFRYFTNIFSSSPPSLVSYEQVASNVERCLSAEQNAFSG